MDNYDVTKQGDKWVLTKQGNERPSKTADTKEEIVKIASSFVGEKGGSVKIHKENGQYQEERTYPRSADPKKSKG